MTVMKARAHTSPSTGPAAARVAGPAARRRVAGARHRGEPDRVVVLPAEDRTADAVTVSPVVDAALDTTVDTTVDTTGDTTTGTTTGRSAERAAETTAEPSPHAEILNSAEAPVVDLPEALVARRRRPPLVPTLLAVCLVAVLAACVLSAVTTRRDRADAAAGTAAVSAARSSAATILSYDYRRLDADFAAATALTTGSFRSDYQATTTKAVAQLATQTKAVVAAKVVAAGVISSTSDRASVLLFVNQTTTSNRLSSAQVDQVRVQVTMSKVKGHWLVSALTAL